MKKVLTLSVGILLCASAVHGQAGAIALYPDPAFDDCSLDDTAPRLAPIYVVHKYTQGAAASQWKVVTGGGFNCIYTGEVVHMPVSIGSALAGISLGYGGCLVSDILLVTINYFCQGLSPVCAYLQVVGDPASGSGSIEVVDCNFVINIVPGGQLYVNVPDCGESCTTPTRDTNWGRVKALYR
jgi:hypothetical protein